MQLAARGLRLASVPIRRLGLRSARAVRLRNEPPAGVRWVHGGRQLMREPLGRGSDSLSPARKVKDFLPYIAEAYGSLKSPNRSFVLPRLSEDRFAAIRQRLEEFLSISDDTDPNNDVCVALLLSNPGDSKWSWVLWLSLVGPFAAFVRVAESPHVVLEPDTRFLCPRESRVFEILAEAGLSPLGALTLAQPISFPNSLDPEQPTFLFHVLFAPLFGLPWGPAA
jgi:hypothetical protein